MALDDAARDLATKLIPPDFHPGRRLKYDLAVSGTLIGIIAVGGWHLAQACGFLTWMGLSGFAMADTATAQQQTLVAIQLGQIENTVRYDKTQVCKAQQTHNQDALTSWARTLDRDAGSYYSISLPHTWPRVNSCDELLVGATNQ